MMPMNKSNLDKFLAELELNIGSIPYATTLKLIAVVKELSAMAEFYNNPKKLIENCPGFCPEYSDVARTALQKCEGIVNV